MSYPRLFISKYGEPSDVLEYSDDNVLADLENLEENQLLIENLASPYHPSIAYAIRGHYPHSGKFPFSPGNDTVSRIAKVGKNVKNYSVGERIIPLVDHGGFSKYHVIEEKDILAKVPDSVDNYNACQFFVNGLTAYILIHEVEKLNKGDWIIQSASGSVVGRAMYQIAKAAGYNVISIVRREEQAEEMRKDGFEHVYTYNDSTNEEELLKKVKEISGGGPKFALEAVCGKTGRFLYNSLGKDSTLVVYGILSGEEIPINGGALFFERKTIKGFWLANWMNEVSREERQKTIDSLVELLAAKKVSLKYDKVFEYKDYKEALEASKKEKIIFVPNKE